MAHETTTDDSIEFTTDRGADVAVTADVGDVRGPLVVSVEGGDVEFDGAHARLDTKKGMDVLNCGHQQTASGETTVALIPVGDHKDDIGALVEAAEERREAEQERKRAAPLTFTVEEHSRRSPDGWQMTNLVLSTSKHTHSDTEQELLDTLRDVVGEVGGRRGVAGKLAAMDGMEVGETYSADELRDRLADEHGDDVAEREAEREREQARDELRSDYPGLLGLSFDPEQVREALAEADETGERVVAATGGGECNDPARECSWDTITAYATPSGEIEAERTHTY